MRRSILFFAAIVCVLVPAVVRAAEPVRRNVVLIVADDLGMDCGCYGNKNIKTPHIDALAASGTLFTHGFAAVSSCSPSRSVIYTGLHTHTSGQYGLQHAVHHQTTLASVKSLPKQLKDAGYRTGIIGKNHVGPPAVYPFDAEITAGLEGNRNVAEIAKRSQQFFAEAGEKPFFLIVGFSDPHRSAKNFGNEKMYKEVPETKYEPKDVLVPSFLPDQPATRQDLAEYYQSTSRLDHGVGLVLKAIKDTGNADRTLVIFLSDNGIPFPGAKTTLYDPGLNLPLIMAAPAQKKRGLRNDGMVSYADITPTILDWASVKPADPLPGRSVLPILEEEHPKGWDTVFGSHQFHEITMYYPMRMIRTRDHKLILNLAHQLEFPTAGDLFGSLTWQGILKRGDKTLGPRTMDGYLHRPREELYDLKKDSQEAKNVAADPAYAKLLDELRTRLKEWQVATKDPWVVKYTHE